MSEAFQASEMDMARRRRYLRKSSVLRQESVCDFPLRVVQIASDMKKILRMVEVYGPTPETTEALAMMEAAIRKEYRNCFGEEMGGGSAE